jgi:hypothetical protein
MLLVRPVRHLESIYVTLRQIPMGKLIPNAGEIARSDNPPTGGGNSSGQSEGVAGTAAPDRAGTGLGTDVRDYPAESGSWTKHHTNCASKGIP